MNDSDELDRLADKHARHREHRLEAVKAWVEYINEHPPEVWGAQQNTLVEAQLESARAADLDADHYQLLDESRPADQP